MSATVHFFIRSERPNPDKSATLYIILTITRLVKPKSSLKYTIPLKKEFSSLSEQDIIDHPKRNDLYCWDDQAELATKEAPNYSLINQFIVAQRKKANDLILRHDLLIEPLTEEAFHLEFGKTVQNTTFEGYFLKMLESLKSSLSEETIKTYKSVVTKISTYKPNLTLSDLNDKFLKEFEDYMLKPQEEGGRGNTARTVANNMNVLKTLIGLATKDKKFKEEQSPFNDYKIGDTQDELTNRDFLDQKELKVLEDLFDSYIPLEKPIQKLSPEEWNYRKLNKQLTPGAYEIIKKFLFSCYTGLRFRDVNLIERKHIFETEIENEVTKKVEKKFYVEMRMHKSIQSKKPLGKLVRIPLIDRAFKLFDLNSEGLLFPKITNQKTNNHLKAIQELSGILKHLTFHVSRHTFGTICFLYGIPDTVRQRLLGHSDKRFTDIYTHVVPQNLILQMDKLNKVNYGIVNKPGNDFGDMLSELQNLNPEQLNQLKGLIKLFGSK